MDDDDDLFSMFLNLGIAIGVVAIEIAVGLAMAVFFLAMAVVDGLFGGMDD